MTDSEFAPAKINLTLHVTGRRTNGYHLLDSLVVFADIGDRVLATMDAGLHLSVTGPQASAVPTGDDNLVLRAARSFGTQQGASITLNKVLPVASGIGGGSADAAATLRVLSRLWRLPLPQAKMVLALGADVPVCLQSAPLRMSGVGETLSVLPDPLPDAWLVLANPGVAVSTPAVFAAMTPRDHAAMRGIPKLTDAADLAAFLQSNRNDLEAPAIELAPVIAHVKGALSTLSGCLIARMSGSGATCYGLFGDPLTAHAAARALQTKEPGWWVKAARILR